MITFNPNYSVNPAFAGKANLRTFERVGKYGDDLLRLTIKSEKPRTYEATGDMFMTRFNSWIDNMLSERFLGPEKTPNEFETWANTFVNNIKEMSTDNEFVEAISNFFKEISK